MQSSVRTADSTSPSALRSRDAIEAYLMLAFTMVAWGGNSVAARLAVGQASPMVIVCLRWAIVASLLGIALRSDLRAAWPELRRHWVRVALMAFAAHHTSGVNLSILQGSVPVLVAIGAFFLHRARMGWLQVTGIAATLIGIAVVATQGHIGTLGAFRLNLGDGFMLIACVLYAGYTLALRTRPHVPSLVLFTAMAIAAFFCSLPMLGYEVWAGSVEWPTAKGWAVLAFIVIFPSFLSQLAFMRGVQLIGPGRAGLFINLVPLTGAFLAVVLLGEPLAMFHVVALVLIIGGILVAELSGRRRAAL
jgi:drug/metabolite transporter (DMT)-like permease